MALPKFQNYAGSKQKSYKFMKMYIIHSNGLGEADVYQ